MTDIANLPIIIIGCPRSGTTLLRRLMDAHSDISCPGESFVLRGVARFLSGERVAEGIDYGPVGGLGALGYSQDDIMAPLRRMALSFHQDLAKADGKSRIALKTAVDSFYLPQIHQIFKGHAKFVCVIRHGADVAMSLRDLSEAMEGIIDELMPYVETHRRLLPAFAAAWADITTNMLDLAEAHGDQVFAFRYEDLVEEPEAVLSELFDFVDAPCDAAALIIETFKPKEVRGLGDFKTFTTKRIQSSSVGRWQNLPERIQAELAPVLNPVLARAGYPEIEAKAADDTDGMRMHELAMMFQSTRDDEAGDDE